MTILRKQFFVFMAVLIGISSLVAQQYNESKDFSYALKLYNEGFYDIAAQQFSAFINSYSGSERLADARFYYGSALYKLNEFEDARIEFQGLAVSFPEHKQAPQAWMMVGKCYTDQDKLEEAAKAYETIKILYQSGAIAPTALLKAAGLRMQLDQLNRAEQILKEFLGQYRESPEFPRGRILYGKLLIKKREFEKAGKEFQAALQLTENQDYQAEAKLGQTAVYQHLGLIGHAVTLLEEVIKHNSGTLSGFEAVSILGNIYLDSKKWDKALSLLRRETPKYSVAGQTEQLKLIGVRALFLKGDILTASKNLEKLEHSSNKNVAFVSGFYQACCKYEDYNYKDALAIYDKLLKIIETEKTGEKYQEALLVNASRIFIKQGDFIQARRYIKRYQSLDTGSPNLESLQIALIKLAFQKNLLSAGVDELQRFRGVFPNSRYRDDLIFYAGKAFFKDHQYPRSLIFFEQIADEYICSSKWDSSLVYINFLKTYYKAGRQTAVSDLAKLMGKLLTGVDRSKLLFELGRIYMSALRDYEEAAKTFEKFIAKSQDSSATGKGLYFLSESYLRLNEYNRFMGVAAKIPQNKVVDVLKKAVSYNNFAPHPDTLTYRFISEMEVGNEIEPERIITFWRHFENSFPHSRLLPQVQLRLAEKKISLGDTLGALKYLDKLIANPTERLITGKAYWHKSNLLGLQGNIDEAIHLLKDFLLAFTKHPYQAKAYRKLAEYHSALRKYSVAAKFWERLAELFDYSPQALAASGKITDNYIREGEYSKALANIETVITRHNNNPDVIIRYYLSSPPPEFYFYAGNAYYQKGDVKKARQYLLTYLNVTQRGEYHSESLLLLGSMANAEEDFQSALLHFSFIKQEEDSSVFFQANQIAADILFNQNKFPEAQAKFDLLIPLTIDADKRMVFETRRLLCLINQGKTTAFGSQLAVFQKNYSKSPQLKSSLAAIEYEKGKRAYADKLFDKAIIHCKTVLKKYKGSPFTDDAQYLVGRSFATLNRSEEALKELEKFLKNYPESDLQANVYLVISEIQFRKEDREAGLATLRKAVETSVTPATQKISFTKLINTYKRMGLWEGVLKNSREFVNKFPNSLDILEKKISIGHSLIRLNRLDEAVKYLKLLKFEVNAESEPEIQFYIGEAFFNSGQYDNAIQEFLKIPLLSQKTKLPWEASAFWYAGQSYEKLGRPGDARRMYQEIIDRPGIQRDLKVEAKRSMEKLKNLN